MNTFLDGSNKISAHVYNNKILLPVTLEVAGVVLGDCVFGYSGDVKGKIFNGTFYGVTGQIAARLGQHLYPPEIDILQTLLEGWRIVQKIKDHEYPWIKPLEKWIPVSIEDFLKHPAWVSVLKQTPQKALL